MRFFSKVGKSKAFHLHYNSLIFCAIVASGTLTAFYANMVSKQVQDISTRR